MKNKLNIFVLLIALVIASVPFVNEAMTEEGVSITKKFENGEIADANDMNYVIGLLEDAINQNLIIPYQYGTPEGMSKVFQQTNSPTTLTSVVTTATMETWTYSDNSRVEYLLESKFDGIYETGRREYNSDGSLKYDLTYEPAVPTADISENKEIGKMWGGATVVKKNDGSVYGTEIRKYTILGVESVVILETTYENCIKVYQTIGPYDSVAWYAEGVGLVKRIGVDGLLELQNHSG